METAKTSAERRETQQEFDALEAKRSGDTLRLARQLEPTNLDSPVGILSSVLSAEARHLPPLDCSRDAWVRLAPS